ncbi:MAG: hypothetical protein RL131_1304, partial [Bacteroidota bacterium]
MTRHQTVLSYILIVLQVFLLILAFVDPQTLPAGIQYFGKFHPLLLHLPIATGILLIPISIWIHKQGIAQIKVAFKTLLSYHAVLATLTALGGLLLASNNEYDADTLFLHKWTGIGIALAAHALIYLNDLLEWKSNYWNLVLAGVTAILIFGSHLGGSLTHGEDFLSLGSKELANNAIPPIDEKTTIYEAGIQPILNTKCVSCHNDQKKKGGLNFSSIEETLKGGKNGAIWAAGDPESSE